MEGHDIFVSEYKYNVENMNIVFETKSKKSVKSKTRNIFEITTEVLVQI